MSNILLSSISVVLTWLISNDGFHTSLPNTLSSSSEPSSSSKSSSTFRPRRRFAPAIRVTAEARALHQAICLLIYWPSAHTATVPGLWVRGFWDTCLGSLGMLLGRLLEPLVKPLGASWRPFGGLLGASFGPLGGLLGYCWRSGGSSWGGGSGM